MWTEPSESWLPSPEVVGAALGGSGSRSVRSSRICADSAAMRGVCAPRAASSRRWMGDGGLVPSSVSAVGTCAALPLTAPPAASGSSLRTGRRSVELRCGCGGVDVALTLLDTLADRCCCSCCFCFCFFVRKRGGGVCSTGDESLRA